MCLTLVVTILASTTEIQLVLSYQYTFGVPVCIDKASMYLRITLVFLTALYMHIKSPSVDTGYSWLNMYFPEDRNTKHSM